MLSFNFSTSPRCFYLREITFELSIAFAYHFISRTHQCRSDLSLDFWFEFGFPYFYIRGEFLLSSLTSGTSNFFHFLQLQHLNTFAIPHIFNFKASSFSHNGVQRESPVRPGLCLLQLDRSSFQLRALDQHRLGRRFPYESFLSRC